MDEKEKADENDQVMESDEETQETSSFSKRMSKISDYVFETEPPAATLQISNPNYVVDQVEENEGNENAIDNIKPLNDSDSEDLFPMSSSSDLFPSQEGTDEEKNKEDKTLISDENLLENTVKLEANHSSNCGVPLFFPTDSHP